MLIITQFNTGRKLQGMAQIYLISSNDIDSIFLISSMHIFLRKVSVKEGSNNFNHNLKI